MSSIKLLSHGVSMLKDNNTNNADAEPQGHVLFYL